MPRKSHHAASSGAGVGAFDTVGFVEGAAVGVEDGAEEGTAVGTVVGTCVGTGTGIGVGCGDTVGADDGTAVGSAVGSAVGRAVGSDVGTALGCPVGATLVCACAAATSNAYRARQPGRSISSCSCVTCPSALLLGSPLLPSMATRRLRAIGAASDTSCSIKWSRCDAQTGAWGLGVGRTTLYCNGAFGFFNAPGQNVDRPTDVAHCSVGFAGAGLLRRNSAYYET